MYKKTTPYKLVLNVDKMHPVFTEVYSTERGWEWGGGRGRGGG